MRASAVICAAIVAALAVPAASFADTTTDLSLHAIDSSRYPVVTLDVALPGAAAEDPAFTLHENGVARAVDAVRADSGRGPAGVTLVLDTSGSMAGRPWRDAQTAVDAFLARLDPSVPVSLVTFDERAAQRVASTPDRSRVSAALEAIAPSGETALYDAVVEAARRDTVSAGRRVIVLLSDGGDTVSATSFRTAVRALARSETPLYAVSLESAEQDPRALRLLARRSGGRLVSATDSAELVGLFGSIADEIGGTYRLTFTSAKPRTKDIEIDVAGEASGSRTEARTSFPNPLYLAPAGAPVVTLRSPEEDTTSLALATGLVFLGVIAGAGAVLATVFRERTMLSHVRLYDQEDRRGAWRGTAGAYRGLKRRWIRATERILDRTGLGERLTPGFEAAGIAGRLYEYAAAYSAAALAVTLALLLATGDPLVVLIVVAVLGVAPRLLLQVAAERRTQAIERQLPEALSSIATSLRGGWTLERAIEAAATDAPEPIREEFANVSAWLELGMPVTAALAKMAQRLDSRDFDAVVSGVSVQREVGGSLAEVLDMVTETMREREALRRQVRTLTAEARLSAYILIGLPFALVALMFLTSRSYISELFTTSSGLAVTAIASVMIAGGSVWIHRLTRIEV